MKALDRKLLRDLWTIKTQVVSIALVIACGIGGFLASMSTHESLLLSRARYYDAARFPHVFAEARRAPDFLAARIADIPGVSAVQTRVVRDVQLDVPGVVQPMTARVIGIPVGSIVDAALPQAMNRLSLKTGRWPAPGAAGEVLVNNRFAEVRKLALGSEIRVLLNGKRERLTIVGTALSPEFIFVTRGGALPDDEWFAVIWMDAGALAAAYNMEGAFNSVALRLADGSRIRDGETAGDAATAAVVAELDRLLEPYGTRGGYGRAEQISHKVLSQEIEQQRVMGTILPAVFLLVAAFILNVVLHRQVNAQRGEIAALKALGYEDLAIGWHYLKLAAVVVAAGILIGIALGDWLGRTITALYTEFFRFPTLSYVLAPWVVATGSLVALLAGFGGTLAAIRGVVALKPAEALRPPAPAEFRPLLLERLGLGRLATPAQRMILRNIERRPGRAAMTVAGIAGSVAIVISGTFWTDAVDHFIDIQFHVAQPAAVYLGFAEPVPESVRFDLSRLPGVRQVETSRTVGARLRAGHRSYRAGVTGLADGAQLQRIIDVDTGQAAPAPDAVLLTTRVARRLGVGPGDTVTLELMEGRRAQATLRVAGTVHELAGMNAWMRLADLNRIVGDGPVVSTAALVVDRAEQDALLTRLKDIPGVATVIVKSTLLDSFRATSARNLLFYTGVLTIFAAIIAVGVVYNNARIQLAERAWELASLRVLGMTRGEVSVLLLGELAIEILLAIPAGFVAGYCLALLIVTLTHGEAFEIPLVILPPTYLYAGATVVVAGVVSALIVRNRIDNLDLVAVLKTRE
ncbi:MAG: ABC transporter permease [Betaproteobacteria bacterium]|nr:ABC transporter permease [Betaproteobacteria bacterium]